MFTCELYSISEFWDLLLIGYLIKGTFKFYFLSLLPHKVYMLGCLQILDFEIIHTLSYESSSKEHLNAYVVHYCHHKVYMLWGWIDHVHIILLPYLIVKVVFHNVILYQQSFVKKLSLLKCFLSTGTEGLFLYNFQHLMINLPIISIMKQLHMKLSFLCIYTTALHQSLTLSWQGIFWSFCQNWVTVSNCE